MSPCSSAPATLPCAAPAGRWRPAGCSTVNPERYSFPAILRIQTGRPSNSQQCYEPAWGRHKDRTRPAPGNHEYGSPGAAPYFAYFGANAGPAGLGYYTYRKGTWQVFSLNSNTESADRRLQVDWLERELQAPRRLGVHRRVLSSSALQLGTRTASFRRCQWLSTCGERFTSRARTSSSRRTNTSTSVSRRRRPTACRIRSSVSVSSSSAPVARR